MKFSGYALVVFGFADFGLSWVGLDVWGEIIGVQLPQLLWTFSGMIEIAIGYGIVNLANGGGNNEAD